jgi:hypothetical protein
VVFLTMDLDYRGYPGFSGYLARRYALAAEDPDMRALERFYKGYRAIVRGKVAALTSVDPDLEAERRGALRAEAMRYFQLAAAYELPPAMILTCGLPGSGKSWLARRLAGALRAAVLRSDVRRKVLAGVPRTTHVPSSYGTGLYAPDMQVRTYRSLLADALRHLRAGHSVIVDATFARRDYRRPFVEAAARLGLPCHVAHVSAPEAVIRERLERRGADDREASDADLAVYLRARESFEPPTEVPPECLLEVTSGAGLPEVAGAQVIDGMIARATARAENEALLPRRST